MSGHHISTDKQLWSVAIGLIILTVITVALAYIDIPEPFNVIVALAVAFFKAGLVALFFMNLYWDVKFNSMLLITSIVFFGLLIGITLLDTLFRSDPVPGF